MFKTRLARVAVLISSGIISSYSMADTYSVDTGSSTLTWEASKVTGSHDGVVKLKEGQLDWAKKTGKFVMDMNTIENKDLSGKYKKMIEDHLKNEDFFAVTKYPTANFVLKKAEAKKGEDYLLTGDLTVKDTTKAISFPAKVSQNGDKINIKAKFEIDRTEYDIRYRSGKFFDAKELGDKLIYDAITIGLDVNAQKTKKTS